MCVETKTEVAMQSSKTRFGGCFFFFEEPNDFFSEET